jgi:hypothetical protein
MNQVPRLLTWPLALCLGIPGAEAQPKPHQSEYHPLNVGTTWQYKVISKEWKLPVTRRVTRHETVGNSLYAHLEFEAAGLSCPEGYVVVDATGISTLPPPLVRGEPDTPMLLLRLPPKDGGAWVSKGKVHGLPVESRCAVSKEKVKVSAGEFEAFKISCEVTTDGKATHKAITWLAKGVGPVKSLLTTADRATALHWP